MTLFGRMHRPPEDPPASSPTMWLAAGLGLTSLLLARLSLRLDPPMQVPSATRWTP